MSDFRTGGSFLPGVTEVLEVALEIVKDSRPVENMATQRFDLAEWPCLRFFKTVAIEYWKPQIL